MAQNSLPHPAAASGPPSLLQRYQDWIRHPPAIFAYVSPVVLLINAISYPFYSAWIVFALIPGHTFLSHYYLWNVVTYPLVHGRILAMILDLVLFLAYSKFLESRWSVLRTAKFMAVVTVTSGLATFFASVALYAASQRTRYLFDPVWGFTALTCGLAVAVKQLAPTHDVDLTFFVLPVQVLPLTVVSLCSVVALVTRHYPTLVLAWSGFFYAWVYLRFFATSLQDDSIAGDQSEEFSFHDFFPRGPLQTIAQQGGALVWVVTQRFLPSNNSNDPPRRAPYQPYAAIPNAGVHDTPVPPISPLPGSDQRDADRRRARALEALDRRLASMAQVPDIPLDSADGDDDSVNADRGVSDPTQNGQG